MTTKCLVLLEEGISLRRKSEQEAQAFISAQKGKEQMDAIRGLVAEMKREEADLLGEREVRSSFAYQTAVTTGLLERPAGLGTVRCLRLAPPTQPHGSAEGRSSPPRAEEWFQTTLASIGDAVIATDTEGHVSLRV